MAGNAITPHCKRGREWHGGEIPKENLRPIRQPLQGEQTSLPRSPLALRLALPRPPPVFAELLPVLWG